MSAKEEEVGFCGDVGVYDGDGHIREQLRLLSGDINAAERDRTRQMREDTERLDALERDTKDLKEQTRSLFDRVDAAERGAQETRNALDEIQKRTDEIRERLKKREVANAIYWTWNGFLNRVIEAFYILDITGPEDEGDRDDEARFDSDDENEDRQSAMDALSEFLKLSDEARAELLAKRRRHGGATSQSFRMLSATNEAFPWLDAATARRAQESFGREQFHAQMDFWDWNKAQAREIFREHRPEDLDLFERLASTMPEDLQRAYSSPNASPDGLYARLNLLQSPLEPEKAEGEGSEVLTKSASRAREP